MSWIKKERDEFINTYERTYGVRLSEKDEMLPIMHFIYNAGNETINKLNNTDALVAKIEKLLKDSNFRRTPIVLQDGQAWAWQIGIAVKSIIILVAISLAIIAGYFVDAWHSEEKASALKIVNSADAIQNGLLSRALEDSNGNIFLSFEPPKGKSLKLYSNYEFRKDSSVRVYLKFAR